VPEVGEPFGEGAALVVAGASGGHCCGQAVQGVRGEGAVDPSAGCALVSTTGFERVIVASVAFEG